MAAVRRYAGLLFIAALILAAILWFVTRNGDRPATDAIETVTVRSVPSAPRPAGPAPAAKPLLEPPTAPSLPGAVPATSDSFVGEWRTARGERLHVTTAGNDRYSVTLNDERYDGILKDGHLHFTRGIDGDWLQMMENEPCLMLGSGTRFCRLGR
ncbi:hypothetical protein [Sphingomonas sanguinis]|uniref:hypothetical protein n=1 Tax=Sphingomonas sanguinis TaxID=33051 RepID=UPI003015913F